MQLPPNLRHHHVWTLAGPMGPVLPQSFAKNPVLAVDGGAAFCEKMDVWVGDGDSHLEDVKCSHQFQFSPQKSESDLALALKLLGQISPLTIEAWGFLGGRRDHELLNLGETLTFLSLRSGARVHFYDQDGALAVECLGPGQWSIHRQGLFTLASIQDVVLKMTGACEYTIPEEICLAPLSSLGLSNRGHGEIQLLTQGAVMLLYGDKR